VRQIITNLIGNAVKFTPEKGVIVLGITCKTKTKTDATYEFYVKDTGIGMTQEQMDKLFTPFSQADTSTTRKYGGTGLGLKISKQLVELMDGEIHAQSSYGQGATFGFTIPLKLDAVKSESPLVAPEQLSGLKVLVIDDIQESRLITSKLLSSFGFHTDSVSSGQEAIEKLKVFCGEPSPYGLIIMDWQMPEKNGIEISMIRKELNLSVPIIILTPYGRDKETKIVKEAAINGFLTKPINSSSLFDVIMDVFGKPSQTQEAHGDIHTRNLEFKNQLKGARILLVEDNFINQEIAKAMLEGAGIEVDLADNGKVGVERVYQVNYDAVLMDIQMPVMDGFEACCRIRENSQFASLPIIAMTAHAVKGYEKKVLDSGMDGYVTKPINQEKLFNTLSRFIKEPVSLKGKVNFTQTYSGVVSHINTQFQAKDLVTLKKTVHPLIASAKQINEKKVYNLSRKIVSLCEKEQAIIPDNLIEALEKELRVIFDAATLKD
ncbi:MAG: response regulator, partial [Desulfobacteraceae bacterium]|nr:response regulator [Desulfobacteraceae bacterium]